MNEGKVELRTCVRCHRMFQYTGYGHVYCPECKKKDEEDFVRIRECIEEYGVASMIELSNMTGISVKRIKEYLREGRLEIPENSTVYIKCEKCGTNIRSGRFCAECAAKLSRDLREGLGFDEAQVGEKPKTSKGKMRFLQKHDR